MIDTLRDVVKVSKKTDREKQLSSDYTVRLENFEDDGADAVLGEMVRCQNTNLPSEIDGDDRKSLVAERLGHSVVFRYNHKTGKLGIQYDNRIMSPGRLLDYLSSFNSNAVYSINPIINKEAWKRFNSGTTRKLIVRIANPSDMTDLSGVGRAAAQGIKSMGDAYSAPYIEVALSMGTRKGGLSKIPELAKELVSLTGIGANIDKLKATAIVNDASEEIDLIQDRLVAKDSLYLDDRDPDRNWEIKKNYLSKQMKATVGC